jgi:dTDP-4-amino-4,6-dideoxygalactose transaminase
MCAIQFVDLKKQYAPLKEDILDGVAKVLEEMHLNLGENIQAMEKEFAAFCGAEYGIGISDGTSALHIILRALGIGPGDEVITVSHTFIATSEAIVLAGATPVFVDIDPHTFLMDINKVEAAITPRTKAIMPVDLYGQPVDMDPLMEIAARHGLKVIEDACQAHGARYKGRRSGTLADVGAFSFYCSKNLGAYGEGGFITTNDADLARKVRMIRDHGSETRYKHDMIGFNARPDEIQAVVIRTKLPHLPEWNDTRRRHAALYNQLLADTPVITPGVLPDAEPVYHLYVIRAPRRDELQVYLKEKGIFTGIHYPIPVHLQKALAYLGGKPGDLPVTEEVVGDILSLPMFAELEDHEIEMVVKAIKDFYQKG